MIGPLALLAIAQTTSTTSIESRALRVVLMPTYAKPVARGPSALDDRVLGAFTRELHEEARRMFAYRRWSVPPARSVDRSVERAGGRSKCLDARCYDAIAVELKASHWLAARVVEAAKHRCFATVVLQDAESDKRVLRTQRTIEPCTVDNAVLAARVLGREVSAGSREPIRITHSYTDLSSPSLEIPAIPDIELLDTATAARDRGDLGLDRALSIYKQRYLIAFNQELEPRDWHTFVAQDGKLIDECTVRKAAGAPVDDALETFCEGNNWEWAWLGVPVGAVVSIGSFRGLRSGTAPGVLGFVFGAIASFVSGTLALTLNEDAADPEDGEYWSHWTELEQMVESSNEALRQKLDLTAAEVEAAGMRR